MKKNDFKKLKGEDLFYYFTRDHNDKDYSSIVEMLPYALMDRDEALRVLENITKNGKKLVAIYPGNGEKPTTGMQFIGSIPDGGLYIK
jgi:hypothetical protein